MPNGYTHFLLEFVPNITDIDTMPVLLGTGISFAVSVLGILSIVVTISLLSSISNNGEIIVKISLKLKALLGSVLVAMGLRKRHLKQNLVVLSTIIFATSLGSCGVEKKDSRENGGTTAKGAHLTDYEQYASSGNYGAAGQPSSTTMPNSQPTPTPMPNPQPTPTPMPGDENIVEIVVREEAVIDGITIPARKEKFNCKSIPSQYSDPKGAKDKYYQFKGEYQKLSKEIDALTPQLAVLLSALAGGGYYDYASYFAAYTNYQNLYNKIAELQRSKSNAKYYARRAKTIQNIAESIEDACNQLAVTY